MSDPPAPGDAPHRQRMLADLQALVEAIDRRLPQLQRSSELQIAKEAADLREKAMQLIRELQDDPAPPD
jgi:hypothetical protein